MASGGNLAYDSDQESIDLNELPCFGLEHGGNTKTDSETSEMVIASLVDAECAETRTTERMEEIAKEMQLFSLEECEETKIPIVDDLTKHKCIELQPPGIPFFTSSAHHHIYSEDTLVWPFAGVTGKHEVFSHMSPAELEKNILEGFFERQYISMKKVKLLIRYLFHLMCCTKDTAIMHCTFRTLSYILDNNSVNIGLLNDLLLALVNMGGNVAKLGKDTSGLSSPVILHSNKMEVELKKPLGIFKENKTLMLKFLNIHLAKSKKYSSSQLDELLKIILAVGLDPLILDIGVSICVSNVINHILNLYPSNQDFCERVLVLVEHITVYCDFHHHTVAYVCLNYLLPTQKQGQILRSSLAYLQAEINLQRDRKDILEIVEVEDVLNLIDEQLHIFSEETDSYLLLNALTLLDICLGDDPLQAEERALLQDMCNTIEPVIKKRWRRMDIEDANNLNLIHFTDRLMIKWKQKAGQVKRQQTLMELKPTYSSGSMSNYSSGLKSIQANYSEELNE